MDKNPSHAQSKAKAYARITSPAALSVGEGKLPTRMKILNLVENPNSQGKKAAVGKRLIQAMTEPTYPFHEIALDYEHNTCPGTTEYQRTQEPRPIAAFLRVDVVEGAGVFVNVERWTPDGEKNAQHYCDLSAVPLMDADGNVTSIISVALSRAGAVPDITFSQAALAAMAVITNPKGNTQMTHREMLIGLLGLEADATDEAIAAAYNAAREKDAAKPDEPVKEEAKQVEESAALSAIKVLASQFADMGARLDSHEKERIIAAATAEGKVVALSAEIVSKLSLDDLRKHCQELPKSVPLVGLTPVKVAENKTVELSATELEVAKSLGLTAEEYAKEKGK